MSRARLHLIHCRADTEPQARDRRRERSFRPTVIEGGRRPSVAERANSWEALFGVFDQAFLIAEATCAAFLAASLTTLELHSTTDTRQTNQDIRRTE
jgi:hypothetical protein